MKKFISLALVIAMVLTISLAFTGCSTKTQTYFELVDNPDGTLKLGFDAEYKPYGYLDVETNQYVGFDIEYAKAVCKDMNYNLELIPINWDAKDNELSSGNIDCIWSGFTRNEEREALYAWTEPYADSSIVVMTKADSGIVTLTDLAGKNVSVQKDSSGESALKEQTDLVATFNGSTYLTCADYNTGFADLEAGGIDALVIDIGVADSLKSDDYVILEEQLATEKYAVGFEKNNTALRDKVEASMKNLAGEAKKIGKTYGIENSIIISK